MAGAWCMTRAGAAPALVCYEELQWVGSSGEAGQPRHPPAAEGRGAVVRLSAAWRPVAPAGGAQAVAAAPRAHGWRHRDDF